MKHETKTSYLSCKAFIQVITEHRSRNVGGDLLSTSRMKILLSVRRARND